MAQPREFSDINHGGMTIATLDSMELATSPPASQLLHTLSLLPSPPPHTRLLDVACGGGCVFLAFLKEWDGTTPLEYALGVDREASLLGLAEERVGRDRMGQQGMEFGVMLAEDLSALSDASFTHATFNFGPQLLPGDNAQIALKELSRILRPSGKLGFTIWTHPGTFPTFLRAGIPLPALNSSPWVDPIWITSLLTTLGFPHSTIRVEPISFNRTHTVEGLVGMMKAVLPGLWEAEAEVGRRYEEAVVGMRGEDGGVELKWEGLVVTGTKAG